MAPTTEEHIARGKLLALDRIENLGI